MVILLSLRYSFGILTASMTVWLERFFKCIRLLSKPRPNQNKTFSYLYLKLPCLPLGLNEKTCEEKAATLFVADLAKTLIGIPPSLRDRLVMEFRSLPVVVCSTIALQSTLVANI